MSSSIPDNKTRQYLAFMRQGQFDNALLMANELSQAFPEDPDGYSMIADAFTNKGVYDKAAVFYEYALLKKPQQPAVLRALGQTYRLLGDLGRAYHYYLQAVEIAPDDASVLNSLGSFLVFAGEVDEAEAVLSKARKLGHPEALFGLLSVAVYAGDREKIEQLLAEVNLRNQAQRIVIAQALEKVGRHEEALDYLQRFHLQNKSNASKRIVYHLMANLLYKQKKHREAFDAYTRMNQCMHGNYDATRQEKISASVIEQVQKMEPVALTPTTENTRVPVFILGLPRSGSSLLEQILATNHRLKAGGEMVFIEPMYDRWLKGESPASLRNWYFEKTKMTLPAESYSHFTDKLPGNYLYSGFIARLFPEAKIIYIRRNPVETGFSIFRQAFTSGHSYSFDQHTIAHYVYLVRNTMDSWLQRIPQTQITVVDYESLISDFESQTRQLFDFMGLEWSDAVFAFHRSGLNTKTASHDQVKSPLYRSALSASEPYREYLQPMIQQLKNYGISVDTDSVFSS